MNNKTTTQLNNDIIWIQFSQDKQNGQQTHEKMIYHHSKMQTKTTMRCLFIAITIVLKIK